MNWILSSLLGTFVGINIVALVIFLLYRQNREKYLLYFASGWFIASIRYLLMLFIRTVPDTTLIYIIGLLSSVTGGILFLCAICYLLEKKPPFLLRIIFIVAALWILIAAPLRIPRVIMILTAEVTAGIIFIISGILLFASKKTRGMGNAILGTALIFFGIIKSEFSLFINNESVRPWNFVFLSITATAASLGILMVYIQKAKDNLSLSEKKYRTLVENAHNIVCLLDAQETITFLNKFGLDFFGYTADEISGKKSFEIFSSKKPLSISAKIAEYDKDTSAKNVITERMENLKQDGSRVIVNWFFKPIFDEEENLVEILCAGIDETEREKAEKEKKKLQDQLFQAQKMESIGRLAGSIAHDFNNILASIMGNAEYLKLAGKTKKRSPGKVVDIIIKESERAAHLTRQLLGFARKVESYPTPIAINHVINETLSVSERIFKKQIGLELRLNEGVKLIEADEGQLQQVFTNLIINAKDAMQKGGTLTIKSENFLTDDSFVSRFPEFITGEYVKISFCDTGAGIPGQDIENIFEPFFTTKGDSGTGLGLSVVYGIVKNHKGHIHVSSEVGKGTCFDLYFPALAEGRERKRERKRKPTVPKSRATILVIDDESFFRSIIKEMLETLGHRVYTAENGEIGLNIFKEKKDYIDLILIDIIMPIMDGKEIFKKLLKIDPDAKVILTSGFSQDEQLTELINRSSCVFLQKPFKLEELAEIINKIFSKSFPKNKSK